MPGYPTVELTLQEGVSGDACTMTIKARSTERILLFKESP
jgi:hypothetical protein